MNAVASQPSLSALVGLLAEQALLAMGVPHPMLPEQPPPNHVAARFYVDLIAVLKDKTEGHRTEAETREIEEVLYHLRMRILGLKQGVPPEPGQEPEGARS